LFNILSVVETVTDRWGDQWQEHLKKEQSADTLGDLQRPDENLPFDTNGGGGGKARRAQPPTNP
jgi:hypothetical protein